MLSNYLANYMPYNIAITLTDLIVSLLVIGIAAIVLYIYNKVIKND